ncbi:hypothetical protein TNIN_381991 [Trichonephila inaurata madagascariensis]|uniref:Uncharacterized protein n=1 Tax=Trichonephila inaurata madagascariensis TaxID=2747483 RepID=A0A8X6Y9F8_9ARAC|nr:hypothetical protein TNIN_381991 [Trichonephila inaurata madagascariensis]
MCVCSCSNSGMNLQKIAADIEFKGFKKNSHSCSCEDFLIPRLHSSQRSLQVNKTCEFCYCKEVSESKCVNGKVTCRSLYLIEATTICILLLALFLNELVLIYNYEPRIYCLILRKKSHKKFGGNPTIV